jgi:hypothetical protein
MCGSIYRDRRHGTAGAGAMRVESGEVRIVGPRRPVGVVAERGDGTAGSRRASRQGGPSSSYLLVRAERY